jgi:ASC-1-like (ASCH) protein
MKYSKVKKNIQLKKSRQNKSKRMTSQVYEKYVQEPWFSLIQTGIKVVEGRPKKGMFENIKKGDVIYWTNDITGKIRKCKTLIVDVIYYDTFNEMIQNEGLINVLPATGAGINTVEDGVNKVYRQLYGPDVEKKYGVCAIKMNVIT